eukprot:816635_1
MCYTLCSAVTLKMKLHLIMAEQTGDGIFLDALNDMYSTAERMYGTAQTRYESAVKDTTLKKLDFKFAFGIFVFLILFLVVSIVFEFTEDYPSDHGRRRRAVAAVPQEDLPEEGMCVGLKEALTLRNFIDIPVNASNAVSPAEPLELTCPHPFDSHKKITVACTAGQMVINSGDCLTSMQCPLFPMNSIHGRMPLVQFDPIHDLQFTTPQQWDATTKVTCNKGDLPILLKCAMKDDQDGDYGEWVVADYDLVEQCSKGTDAAAEDVSFNKVRKDFFTLLGQSAAPSVSYALPIVLGLVATFYLM